ncbi:hypothetical protein A1O1_08925 [Capronia coronata CBS 617.96]|uniref:Uncharacterized protein n=1 Tax=Capronia coronata CBS 617.96 TaxID=1182541 RepID=W9Y7Z7_9EURO|nr:uncharacterized protein A1O1_08925 [Capronia coronata CBS 617.96]EXJ78524.1 hypothetical protein A1O1_08925 [Capronia coronata CBS 617.96]
MRHLRMTALLRPGAGETARWWLCATRKRCLKHGPAATARYIIEDGLFTAATWPTVTQIGTGMIATL